MWHISVGFKEFASLFIFTECHSGHYVMTIEKLEILMQCLEGDSDINFYKLIKKFKL